MESHEREALLTAAIGGDAAALGRLLLDRYDHLQRMIAARLPRELARTVAAEDIVQDAFAQAFRGIASFQPDGPDSFERWLMRVANNRLRDAIKRQRTIKRGGGAAVSTAPPSPDHSVLDLLALVATTSRTPSRSAIHREEIARLHEAVDQLKPTYRQAIRLRYFEGLEVDQVAGQMGLNKGAVHMLCSRAIATLARTLGIPSSSGAAARDQRR